MRAFLAIELSPPIQAELLKIQRELASARADVKWVEEQHLHITLRFLGDISDEQRWAIEQLLETAARRMHPLEAAFSGLGAFPSPQAPRVIWAGLGQGKEELGRLAHELEAGLSTLGFAGEARGFVAHVTLGRVRSPKNRSQLAAHLQAFVWKPPAPFRVEHVTLFESVLSSSGPRYTALARATFS